MHSKQESCNLLFRTILPATTAVFARAIVLALTLLLAQTVQAQTYRVIHTFIGGEGSNPFAGVVVDPSGRLYGTTTNWPTCWEWPGGGSVYKLWPENGNWIFEPLATSGADGWCPFGGLIRDANGVLYGTYFTGSYGWGWGTIFVLEAAPRAWRNISEKWWRPTLYTFQGNGDGGAPYDTLAFDQAGNLYGTTYLEGDYGCGLVFKLTYSGGIWTKSNLYSFMGSPYHDGCGPFAGLVFDRTGNLYGTTKEGSTQSYYLNCGTVFELAPSGSGWTETVLYSFSGKGDGCNPQAGVTLDEAGNLYGATLNTLQSPSGAGTVFELSSSQGNWNYSLLYTFDGNGSTCPGGGGAQGSGPASSLTLDSGGSIYGTTQNDGAYGYGNVFKLAPSSGGWTYSSLHDFTGVDGANPCGGVAFDTSGNLYGTTWTGDLDHYYGVVWEITQ